MGENKNTFIFASICTEKLGGHTGDWKGWLAMLGVGGQEGLSPSFMMVLNLKLCWTYYIFEASMLQNSI